MKSGKWIEIARTEMIKDNLNPDFEQAFTVDYFFEKKQDYKFRMIDDDGGGKFDLIGECATTLGAVMGAKRQVFVSHLTKDGGTASQGELIVRAENVQKSKVGCKLKYRWQNVNNLSKGFLGVGKKRQRVRFEIGREIPGTGNFAEIAATPHIKQPKEPDFDIPLRVYSL